MNTQGIEDISELTPLQQGMLFHTLYEPESRLYFEQVVVPFEGGVNRSAFEKAWTCVADADTAVRTSFHWEEIAKPVQVVHNSAPVPVEFRDLRTVEPARSDPAIEALLADDRQRGFDLQRAPLFRVTLIQLSASSYRLVLTFHHIILDGWSLQLVVAQFSEAYAALCTGRTPNLLKTRPYSDHIRWLQKQDLNAARSYWRRALAGLDGSCSLLPGNAAAVPVSDYAEQSLQLSAEASDALRQFAAAHKLTLNTLVQGAWALLIYRLTGCRDVIFGVTVSGRPADLRDVEKMVGLFINTVPLRARIDPENRVTAWLEDLQRQQFEARQFDYSPLVQIREWSELLGSGPLFETLLAFENYPVQTRGTDGASHAVFVERTNYPLSAAVVPGPRVHIRLLYNQGLLTSDAVRRIGANYELLLTELAESEGKPIADLEALTAEDRALLTRVNDTRTEYPAEATINTLWNEVVFASPDAPALEFGSHRMTYAELDRAAGKVAAKLRSMGVRREATVAVLLDRSVQFITAILAIVKAEAAYLPLDPAYPNARLTGIVEDIGAEIMVTSSRYADRVRGCPVRALLMDSATSERDEEQEPLGDSDGLPEDVAYVMYTSGSTGTPKGIVVPHRAVVRLVRNTTYISIEPQDRIANLSNCAFDASTFEIWGALLNGACVVGLERDATLMPGALSAELRQKRISILFLTTALLNQVAADTPDAFCTLRALLFGGEAVDPKWVRLVLQTAPPQSIGHVYGPTESTTFATWQHVTGVDADAATIPIGSAIGNTTAYVLDASLNYVPAGGIGELYLSGDGLARGYYGRAGATAERFLPDPFADRRGARMYRTGDRVRWRLDGALEFLGRLDTQVKIRGHRIELGELERRLKEHPAVLQAVVVVRPNESRERTLAAYYVARDGEHGPLGQELRALLREHLPEYMQPSTLQRVAALPLNSNGKVDHAALPDPEPDRSELEQGFVEPTDEIERKLVSLWQDVLGLKRVGTHDGFFDIGGHSLRATQLVSRMRRELGVEIPLRAVFERPTIAKMAELLRQQKTSGPAPAIARLSRDQRRRVLGAHGGAFGG
jgi:amino acid adenylation domain-containing protein